MVDDDIDVLAKVEYFEDLELLENGLELGREDARKVCGGVLLDIEIDRLRGDWSVRRRIDR